MIASTCAWSKTFMRGHRSARELFRNANRVAQPALAFDLMSLDGEDFRRHPYSERNAVLKNVLKRTRRGIQYVEHTEGDGAKMFNTVCKLGLEGIVSKKLDAPYKSGPIKNPKAPAAIRAIDGTFSSRGKRAGRRVSAFPMGTERSPSLGTEGSATGFG